MKKTFLLFILLLPTILYSQVSIYDIQYTTIAGDGTYPSSYNYQTVTTGGIVTANQSDNGRYFISSSNGGAWNGLFVYDNSYSPNIGDSILITGAIAEYNGYTEIKDLTSFSVKSTGNSLPDATEISTNDVDSEAYEGVLVKVTNSDVSSTFDQYNNWKVNDGSGECEVRPNIYDIGTEFDLFLNYSFEYIQGVVGLSYGSRCLFPRSIDDFKSDNNEFVLSTEDKFVETNASLSYPIKISILNQTTSIGSYSLKLQYNSSTFQFDGFTKTGTISESGTITNASTSGNIELNFSGSITSENSSTLVYLNFTPITEGNANLQFNSPTINGSNISHLSIGDLSYGSDPCDIPIGDTLTIVQRPLLNIPSIVLPDQELNIECFAPQTTTDWAVEIFYDDVSISLPLNQANYDTGLDKWTLTTTIPSVDLYELYDMRVSASGGMVDTVTNAVKVIDQFKSDYYFIHITDIHLLGHTFYGESGYATDQSEMDDFYEVIKDINLLNPEFVLLTGDLINEGELEDFECLRNHTLTVQLLEKLEVPVYIVPGNHDLGGWDATPPEQGTARNEWWRFFGWRQQEVPTTESTYQSHDYSFDYGDIHFTGLEAYDNYDGYMYDVYGQYSFTSEQLTWLNQDLATAGDKTKVLFYHYDFKDELDLSTLGVDMALWGHTHSDYNSGSHPYNISTASVCDENRRYRVIRVNNGNLQAESSVSSHSGSTDLLTISYNNSNNGSQDVVSATIQNNHSLSFNHGLVKFIMPKNELGYNVSNGTLKQVLETASSNICYVEVTIPSNSQITTTLSLKTSTADIRSINDIQYTSVAGDGSYPSALTDQSVTTGGIVTATNYFGGNFFISSSQGGAWNGILVYDDSYTPEMGDSVLLTGTVSEYNGYTELTDLTLYEVISSGNSLPNPEPVNTANVLNEEYEGVLIQVNNCNVTEGFDSYGMIKVDDSSGECDIRTGIYNLMDENFTLIDDYEFSQITGVIGINAGHNSVHPRSLNDFQAANNGFIVLTEDQSIDHNNAFSYPIQISIIQSSKTITGYSLQASYSDDVFEYMGYDKTNTVSSSGTITDASSAGEIELNYTGNTTLAKSDTLVRLNFKALATGSANLDFSASNINSNNLIYHDIGNLQSSYENTTGFNQIGTNSKLNFYPNPFKDEIIIEFELQESALVQLSIYSMNGQLVNMLVNENKQPGNYKAKWNASDLNNTKIDAGTYIYRFTLNGKNVSSGQIVYLK